MSSLGSLNQLDKPGAVETEITFSHDSLPEFPRSKDVVLPAVAIGSLTTFNNLMELLLNVQVRRGGAPKYWGFERSSAPSGVSCVGAFRERTL